MSGYYTTRMGWVDETSTTVNELSNASHTHEQLLNPDSSVVFADVSADILTDSITELTPGAGISVNDVMKVNEITCNGGTSSMLVNTLTIDTGRISGNLLPFAANTSSLGSVTYPWKTVRANDRGTAGSGSNIVVVSGTTPTLTTADFNVVVGNNDVGRYLTSQTCNIIIGTYCASTASFNSSDNVIIGCSAGKDIQTGVLTCCGRNCARQTTTGSGSAFGGYASYSNLTGTQFCSFGSNSLYFSTGSYNSAFGFQSGYTVTSGTSNTCLGHQADVSSATGIERTAVGANASCINDYGVQLGQKTVSAGSGQLFFRSQIVSREEWVDTFDRVVSCDGTGNLVKTTIEYAAGSLTVNGDLTVTGKVVGSYEGLSSNDAGITISDDVMCVEISDGAATADFALNPPSGTAGQVIHVYNGSAYNTTAPLGITAGTGKTYFYTGLSWAPC